MNIIVNGGSRGIGREIVRQMAADKANEIIVTGRNEKRLKELETESPHKNVSWMKIDVSNLDKEISIVKNRIFNSFSKVDILINVAGLLIVKDFTETSTHDAHQMMETNFFGPAALIKVLIPIMPPGSHIVNISSMGGYQGSSKYRGMSFYSASKAALACLTECLAVELNDLGISVNCLALGSVQTEMFESAFPGYKAANSPAEIAEFISYFAVNGSSYFNGKILPVAVGNP